jgi:hypothetical protein
MKRIITITIAAICLCAAAQVNAQESHGKTLNLGIGVAGYSGYYRYAGHSIPVFSLNYEFDVARNFTLAPFISFYTYADNYYYSNTNYYYHETVIPVGIKGTYYFDELLDADSRWDFYAAGSLGFAIVNSRWDDNYDGDKHYFNRGSSVFLDVHVGAEYQFTSKLGVFLDLSTGVSTLGIAIHPPR